MYMRVTWGRLKKGCWADYEASYKKIVSELGDIDGLVARWLVQDVNDRDAGYAVSIWESEAALEAYETSDAMKSVITPALTPYYAGEYHATTCEVKSFDSYRAITA